MNNTLAKLERPHFIDGAPMLLAGLREHYTSQNLKNIPAQWGRMPFGKIPGQKNRTAFGLVLDPRNQGCEFDYMAAVEVLDLAAVPKDLARLKIPALQYAVFPHHDHVSKLSDTIGAIWSDWLPSSVYEAAGGMGDVPGVLEFYGEKFDPHSGMGDVEVWVPVKPRRKG